MLTVYLAAYLLLLKSSHGYVELERKVVNGITASDFIPYQASIRVSIRDYARFGRGHTCGGVLVKSMTVLTAAHCIVMDGNSHRTPFDIHVVLGSLNRYMHTSETRIGHIERIIVHPEYRRHESFAHDIGIVILRRPIEFNAAIHSIPLIDHPVEVNSKCQVSGWGAMEWQGFMPDDLQVANVTIRDRTRCNFTYADIITDGMICANGYNIYGVVDVCQGGGPLVCDNQLVGLASFGLQCGASLDHPGVFVDVFYYRDWIMQNWNGARVQKSHSSLFMLTFFINLIWMFVACKKE